MKTHKAHTNPCVCSLELLGIVEKQTYTKTNIASFKIKPLVGASQWPREGGGSGKSLRPTAEGPCSLRCCWVLIAPFCLTTLGLSLEGNFCLFPAACVALFKTGSGIEKNLCLNLESFKGTSFGQKKNHEKIVLKNLKKGIGPLGSSCYKCISS